ncbi:hypothetical protein PENTCL1PPCAC_6797 [Pristionchus entomophagus]|uniref:G protein-coupled receptor n=1 Tax=Pristionchus entomophagus TaxID=358040 RepID=A0AAV5SPC1_9BILA|nr:hypothetical protein PENTCL1PPCAC_6797 [Pristionchus entomophagus]
MQLFTFRNDQSLLIYQNNGKNEGNVLIGYLSISIVCCGCSSSNSRFSGNGNHSFTCFLSVESAVASFSFIFLLLLSNNSVIPEWNRLRVAHSLCAISLRERFHLPTRDRINWLF